MPEEYRGPIALVDADGTAMAVVEAWLWALPPTEDEPGQWGGSFPLPGDLSQGLLAGVAGVRLPTGGEGRATATRVAWGSGQREVELLGDGPPPDW